MSLFVVAIVSLLVSLVVLNLGAFLFKHFGLLDNPVKYGYDRSPVPYSVGIFGVLSFLILSFIFVDFSWQVAVVQIAVLLLGIVCVLDDHYKLPAVLRLGVQVLAAGLVVYGGSQILSVTNPVNFEVIELGWIGFAFSIFWIVSLTNLVNFLDGVSGLSSGVSSIGFLILFALSVMPGMHQTDQTLVQIMALIMFLISFWCFVFEYPSPKFLVGDSGTMFFGFMLGVLSMLNGGKLATAALVLLIPLFDGAWVIFRRVLSKKSPFAGDLDHLHHRLERVGMSKEQILLAYMLVSLIFGLIAVFVWNTLFKVISLVVLVSALSLIGFVVWTKETK